MHVADHQGWCVMPAIAASAVVFSEMLARHWLISGHNKRRRKPHPNSQQLPGIISSPPPPSSSSPMHHTEEALREIHGTASLFDWRQMQQMKNCWLEQFGCSGFTGVCGWIQGKFGL
ncbi:unnamed protein product [Sphagnum balticum]